LYNSIKTFQNSLHQPTGHHDQIDLSFSLFYKKIWSMTEKNSFKHEFFKSGF